MKMKDFRNGVDGLVASAGQLQEEVQKYIVEAMGWLVKDYNTSGLSYLYTAFSEAENVRLVDINILEGYFLLLTGGDTGLTQNGLPLFDPEKSWIYYEKETKSFKVKEGASFDAMYIEAMLEKHPWFAFIPKKRPNPYQFRSLLSALSKAEKNHFLLSPEEKGLVKEMRKLVDGSGLSAQQ